VIAPELSAGVQAAPISAGVPAISFRRLAKAYGEGSTLFQALSDVDLDIGQGEFVAIMGPSGSGKSTAMNIMGCLDTLTSGSYRFLGAPVETLSQDQCAMLRRSYIGFVFQGFNLLRRTSAQENVELPLVYRGLRPAERARRAKAALAEVGLAGWEHHTSSELSGGQQQRVAIARAIVTEPQVLLADEPTGNLDSQRGQEIMQLLVRLNEVRGITVVMVTHEPDMAAYAHRILRFVDGRLVSDTPVAAMPGQPQTAGAPQ
jgi:putative ABC transport system ATP-binding protein